MDREKAEKPVRVMLENYLDHARELDLKLERLGRIDESMQSPKAPRLDGMPHSGGFSDRLADMVSRKDELERKIEELACKQSERRQMIEGYVSQLKKADEREIIRLRYIDRESWPSCCEILYGDSMDFEAKIDTYTKRAFRIHGHALEQLNAIYEAETGGASND